MVVTGWPNRSIWPVQKTNVWHYENTLDGYVDVSETAIVDYVYHLPIKKKNLCFLFPFAANKQKFAVSVFCLQQTNWSCHFPLVQFSIRIIPETLKHGHGDMETWRHRHRNETWKHGDMDMETWVSRHGHGDIDIETLTWRHRHGDIGTETWNFKKSNGKRMPKGNFP